MQLSDIFDKRSINLSMESADKAGAFRELADLAAAVHPELDRDALCAAMHEREAKMNTAIASGVGVPRGYYPGIAGFYGALGVSRQGIDYGAPDNKPVHCLFLLVLGDGFRENHIWALNRILMLSNASAVTRIRAAKTADEVLTILSNVR